MEVTVVERPFYGATVVALSGELAVDGVGQLRDVFTELIGRSATRIVMDLAPLTFCDSIGLSAFVEAHNRCAREGGYVRLAAPSPFLIRVLAVVGLLGRVPVYDSVSGACAGDPRLLTAFPEGLPRGSRPG
jgi:anti-sigma B factor antagonist